MANLKPYTDRMWYKNWFDSDYYHSLYKNRDQEEAEQFLDRLMEKLQLAPNSRILDLPCGRGRHALYLAKKGYQVVAADLSSNSICYAKAEQVSNVEFHVHDMLQEIPFGKFDAVLNLFTSLGYFDESEKDQQVISNMAAVLKKDGVLVIDFLNPEEVRQHLQAYSQIEEDGLTFHVHKKIENGFVIKDVKFSENNADYAYTERVKLLELSDFKRIINATGLQIFSTFGNYSLEPYDKNSSPRMIILARK